MYSTSLRLTIKDDVSVQGEYHDVIDSSEVIVPRTVPAHYDVVPVTRGRVRIHVHFAEPHVSSETTST